jgi:hypothetical protein
VNSWYGMDYGLQLRPEAEHELIESLEEAGQGKEIYSALAAGCFACLQLLK